MSILVDYCSPIHYLPMDDCAAMLSGLTYRKQHTRYGGVMKSDEKVTSLQFSQGRLPMAATKSDVTAIVTGSPADGSSQMWRHCSGHRVACCWQQPKMTSLQWSQGRLPMAATKSDVTAVVTGSPADGRNQKWRHCSGHSVGCRWQQPNSLHPSGRLSVVDVPRLWNQQTSESSQNAPTSPAAQSPAACFGARGNARLVLYNTHFFH